MQVFRIPIGIATSKAVQRYPACSLIAAILYHDAEDGEEPVVATYWPAHALIASSGPLARAAGYD